MLEFVELCYVLFGHWKFLFLLLGSFSFLGFEGGSLFWVLLDDYKVWLSIITNSERINNGRSVACLNTGSRGGMVVIVILVIAAAIKKMGFVYSPIKKKWLLLDKERMKIGLN